MLICRNARSPGPGRSTTAGPRPPGDIRKCGFCVRRTLLRDSSSVCCTRCGSLYHCPGFRPLTRACGGRSPRRWAADSDLCRAARGRWPCRGPASCHSPPSPSPSPSAHALFCRRCKETRYVECCHQQEKSDTVSSALKMKEERWRFWVKLLLSLAVQNNSQ